MFKKKIKKEAMRIEWNVELFEGMKYSEIQEFKKKHRKLIIKNYELSLKKAEVENQLLSAKKSFLYGNKEKNNNQDKIKVVIGGLAIATVCLTSTVTGNAQNKEVANQSDINNNITKVEVAYTKEAQDNVEEEIQEFVNGIISSNEEITTQETTETQDVVENIEIADTAEIVEATEIATAEDVVEVIDTVEAVEMVESIEILENIEEENPQDIIIFDKALEMIMFRCEESFEKFYTSKNVPIMGTYILPHYDDMAAYKVAGWFEAYFGSQALTYNLKYNTAFKVNPEGVEFKNTEDGFKLYIDKNAVNLSVNLDLEDAKNASILGGVSQEMRDYLVSEECLSFLPSLDKMMEANHYNIKKDISESNEFLEFVKSSVENELKALSAYDVEVVFN